MSWEALSAVVLFLLAALLALNMVLEYLKRAHLNATSESLLSARIDKLSETQIAERDRLTQLANRVR